MTDQGFAEWLCREGFTQVVEHDAGDDMPPTDEYWILEALSGEGLDYLVSQDTPTARRWRVAKASSGEGEWSDIATELSAEEAYDLLTKLGIGA